MTKEVSMKKNQSLEAHRRAPIGPPGFQGPPDLKAGLPGVPLRKAGPPMSKKDPGSTGSKCHPQALLLFGCVTSST